MQFTNLRLTGFKSFVDPTDVPIQPGITGIVGPNGCGKSNLVEALRWAMGETSPKSMRGGEMDDVIFAGNANRPSRNLAEVVLGLDNSSRSAPAQFNDHEELEISRRIERGSGSTYRVNGQEVRARDVQLLFADAATGAHSTAMVSQGRIGALINAKPTARRVLLEEAAGITGLHSRRHEAELRLRAAETNLERLDDVISTMEGQLQGLKRQARQATRYRNIAGHIRRNEATLLYLESEEAKRRLAQAEQQLSDSQAAVAAVTEAVATASTEQAEAAAALPELRDAEARAAAALQRLLVDRDNLDREEAQVAAAQIQASQRLEQIESDQARIGAQSEDAKAALARLTQEQAGLTEAAANEQDEQDAAEAKLAACRQAVAEREETLSSLTEHIAADEARRSALERRTRELTQRIERLRNETDSVAQQRRALEERQAHSEALAEAGAALAEAESALEQRRGDSETAEERLSELREREQSARETLQHHQAEQAKLEAEIKALAAMLETGEPDIWPPVIDAVRVEPGYEVALGAALGDDITAPTDEAAPLHWETLPPYDQPRPLPPGVESLAHHVSGPAALNRRLSQVGLVPDSETGKRLQSSLQQGQRLVSRDGGLWRWDGFVVQAGTATAAAIRLEQRNRLAELRSAAGQAEHGLAQAQDGFERAREASRQAGEAERSARDALREAYTTVNQRRDANAKLAQREAEIASRLEGLAERTQRLTGEIDEQEAQLTQARRDWDELPDLAVARGQQSELRAELAERRTELAESQSARDRLIRDRQIRAERLSAIGLESATWQRSAAEAARHLEELGQRHGQVREEIDTLAARPVEIGRKREALASEIDGAEQRRKEAADRLAQGETRQATGDRTLKAEEQKLGQAREARVRAEAAVEQAHEARSQLDQRITERLECTVDALLELAELDPSQGLPDRDQIETKLSRLIRERDNIGPVNLRAEHEAQELEEQIDSMQSERADLVSAIARLRQGISSLNKEGRERLLAAFETVNGHFSELFVRLFGGGRAHLALTEAEDPLDAGLEIMASPPGKRLQVMSLLSGGEQALTALSLLFAVFLTNPAPICVLDEVDAPLDDANVDRFCSLVHELVRRSGTRFLVITHHRMTMARVDRLLGVTMAERGVSQLVSVDLSGAEALRESA